MARATTVAVDRRGDILQAAFARFSRYGYRRTSMEDLAQEAGLSRPALYTYFKNKEEIFRGLALHLHHQAFRDAEAAVADADTPEERLMRAVAVKFGRFGDILQQASHGAELMDENNRICGDISAEYRQKHVRQFKRIIAAGAAAGAFKPERAGLTPGGAAELLMASAQGLELGAAGGMPPRTYRKRLAQLVTVFVASMQDGDPAVKRRSASGGGTS